ncbi:MAG: dUTP diphosphatase [Sandaracinus sp.]|nr:dUTP diphosphatase [Sandaracinus sp.]
MRDAGGAEDGAAGLRLAVRFLRADATLPRYATEGAAGLDLAAALDAPVEIPPGGHALVGTGIAIHLPPGTEGQVRPRSGLAARHAVTVLNAPGTIDEDYRGEVRVILINHGAEPFRIETGDRIAQLVVQPVLRVRVEPTTDEAPATERGTGGFGSTGGFGGSR